MKKILALLLGAAVLTCFAAGVSAGTLDAVKKRGVLICGSNPGLAGFGMPDRKGAWTGLDVDYCRAIAAAIFNDPSKVQFVPLKAADQFTALQSGEVDVLARHDAWTQSREAGLGLLFAPVNYYDGQGFMVKKKRNIASAQQLNGASVCVQRGGAAELNLADYFLAHQMKYEGVAFATADEALKAYDTGRCDALTTDISGLRSERLQLTDPGDNIVLPDVISKEPLAPIVRSGDDQWFEIARWTQFAMIDAEELGITQANLDDEKTSGNPVVGRLLGWDGNFGAAMGLTKDWAYRIVKHVGNYGESFDRNLGMGSPLKIKRGLNALWSQGGLMYAPPIR